MKNDMSKFLETGSPEPVSYFFASLQFFADFLVFYQMIFENPTSNPTAL